MTLVYPGNGATVAFQSLTFNYFVDITSNCTTYVWSNSGSIFRSHNLMYAGPGQLSVSMDNFVNGQYSWNVRCTSPGNEAGGTWGSPAFNWTFTVNSGGSPGVQSDYTSMWSHAIAAAGISDVSAFSFSGAPYIARGPSCKRSMGFEENLAAGFYCNNDWNTPAPGSIAYDLGAVWVTQNENSIAWKIVGPFVSQNSLSVCDGQANDDAAYVIEFDIDANKATGCKNGCYPGADYQIWYFPDTNKGLFGYYKGDNPSVDGDLGGGSCNDNPGHVCYIANTDVPVSVSVTCGTENAALVISVNKNAFPESIRNSLKLNFEINSFNYSRAISDPIDQLTDNGQNAFLFNGTGPDAGACYNFDNTDENTCVNNNQGIKCIWEQTGESKGMCKPHFENFEKGTACFTYATPDECLNSELGYCKWADDPFAKEKSSNGLGLCIEEFKPMEYSGGGNCDTDCFSCFSRQQCENSNANGGKTYGGCQWYNDTFNPMGWCDVKGLKFTCAEMPFNCMSSQDCMAAGWFWSSAWQTCAKDSATEICFNGVDDNSNNLVDCQEQYCKDNSKFCGAGINTLIGNFQGFSPEEAQMQKIMGFNPNVIHLKDDLPDDSTLPSSKSTEIVGFSVVVTPLGLGMGLGMKNSSELKACGGSVEDRKYMFFIDIDANSSTGCPVTLDGTAYAGIDYAIKYGEYKTLNSTLNNTRQLYACVNGGWMLKDAVVLPVNNIQPIDPMQPQLGTIKTPVECGAGGTGPGGSGPGPGPNPGPNPGPVQQERIYPAAVIIEKADVGNPKDNIRFITAVINGQWDSIDSLATYDKLDEIYYTPGTMGFTPVDCSKEPTKCGTEYMVVGEGKFMPFEDCMMPGDEDLDGLVNCADSDCINAPNCQGENEAFNTSSDKTAPKVKMSKVDTFTDKAFITWDTSEPTNGSVLFYYTDASCEQLNAVVGDQGTADNTLDKYKPWHNVPLDNQNLGYGLQPATTYYYKLSSTDTAGNPSQSACLNFTTEATAKNISVMFEYQPPTEEPDTFLGNLSIELNDEPVTIGEYVEQEDITNVNITLYNPNADPENNWSIELVGADLFQDTSMNFSDALIANESGEQGDSIGMKNGEWLDAAQNMGVDYLILTIPETGDQLYHCMDNGTGCIDVTNAPGVEKLDESDGKTSWEVPVTLGFSAYQVGGEGLTCSLVGDYAPCDQVSLTEVINLINKWAKGKAALSNVVSLIAAWAHVS